MSDFASNDGEDNFPFLYTQEDFRQAGYSKRQFNACELIHSKVTRKLRHCSWCSVFLYLQDEYWMLHETGTIYPVQNLLRDKDYSIYFKTRTSAGGEEEVVVLTCTRCIRPESRQLCPISPQWPEEISNIPLVNHSMLAPFSVSSDFVTRRRQALYPTQFKSMVGDWKWSRNTRALSQYLGVPGILLGKDAPSFTQSIRTGIGIFSKSYKRLSSPRALHVEKTSCSLVSHCDYTDNFKYIQSCWRP
jgi:hypothetical protein